MQRLVVGVRLVDLLRSIAFGLNCIVAFVVVAVVAAIVVVVVVVVDVVVVVNISSCAVAYFAAVCSSGCLDY